MLRPMVFFKTATDDTVNNSCFGGGGGGLTTSAPGAVIPQSSVVRGDLLVTYRQLSTHHWPLNFENSFLLYYTAYGYITSEVSA